MAPSVTFTFYRLSAFSKAQTPEGWIGNEYNRRGAWPTRLVYPQTRASTGGPVISVASNRKYDDLGRLYDVKTQVEEVSLPGFAMAGKETSRVYAHDAVTKLRNQLTEEDGDAWFYGYNDRAEVTSGVKKFGPANDNLSGTAIPGTAHSYTIDAIGNRKSPAWPGVRSRCGSAKIWEEAASQGRELGWLLMRCRGFFLRGRFSSFPPGSAALTGKADDRQSPAVRLREESPDTTRQRTVENLRECHAKAGRDR